MIQKQKNTKKYLLTVEVDVEVLQQTYREGLGINESIDLPPIDHLIINEIEGWLSLSGIYLKDIEEIKQ